MGGTKNLLMIKIAKRIWDFLLQKEITLTASWIASIRNVIADKMSRMNPNSSEWSLHHRAFRLICQSFGKPSLDCFASRTMHVVRTYMSLTADPQAIATNALYQDWSPWFPFLFPPFCLLGPPKGLQSMKTDDFERFHIRLKFSKIIARSCHVGRICSVQAG